MSNRILGMWLRYLCIIPGLPPRGDLSTADVVLVQAFGRNQYPDSELDHITDLHVAYGKQDAVTIAKLREQGFDPGQPNRDLALACQQLVDTYGIAAIVQWEVTVAFDPAWYAAHRNRIVSLWPTAEYFSTRLVQEHSLRVMQEHGWTKPIELAHSWQIVRAFLIVRKLFGHEPMVSSETIRCFDSKSVQWWTRSKVKWLAYECLARVHHVLYRWV